MPTSAHVPSLPLASRTSGIRTSASSTTCSLLFSPNTGPRLESKDLQLVAVHDILLLSLRVCAFLPACALHDSSPSTVTITSTFPDSRLGRASASWRLQQHEHPRTQRRLLHRIRHICKPESEEHGILPLPLPVPGPLAQLVVQLLHCDNTYVTRTAPSMRAGRRGGRRTSTSTTARRSPSMVSTSEHTSGVICASASASWSSASTSTTRPSELVSFPRPAPPSQRRAVRPAPHLHLPRFHHPAPPPPYCTRSHPSRTRHGNNSPARAVTLTPNTYSYAETHTTPTSTPKMLPLVHPIGTAMPATLILDCTGRASLHGALLHTRIECQSHRHRVRKPPRRLEQLSHTLQFHGGLSCHPPSLVPKKEKESEHGPRATTAEVARLC
ncbi:hypothetical protein B0H16DRAFT_1884186 [Mycena metata]|uniref:Uncharacterized protein n=1 Tax=Mycena metata TaxID=1033252 RepID=A0AAD7JD91_9AGAR|nr:hypothetical protein B0H16DRAFT_1884186 [Mycena metata]